MKRLSYSLLLGVCMGMAIGHFTPAQAEDYSTKVTAGEPSKYQHPEDVLDMVPFLSEIPRSFLIGDGYQMKLSGRELRIDHMGADSHVPVSRRNCSLGLSYTTPVAFFTSRVDIPLFSASTLAWDSWTRNSIGDYVVYLSKTPVDNASLRLVLSAKF